MDTVITYQILSVCADTRQNWIAVGRSREEADRNYRMGLDKGWFKKPVYRVVVARKAA